MLEHLPRVICKTLNGSPAGLYIASQLGLQECGLLMERLSSVTHKSLGLIFLSGWLALDKTTLVSELRGHIQRRANGVQPNPMPAWNAGGEEAVSSVLEKFSGSCTLSILEA